MANGPERRAIKKALKEISAARQQAEQAAAGKKQLPEDTEWLLDNGYIAQREGVEAEKALKAVPAGAALEAARLFLKRPDWEISEAQLLAFLTDCQAERPFSERELCAFPAALKGALVQALAWACGQLGEKESGVELGRYFTALRSLSSLDLAPILESANRTEALFRRDPAGIYEEMDETSRAEYRRQLAKLARRRGLQEYAMAQTLLEKAEQAGKHIGFFLFPQEKREQSRGGLYIAVLVLVSTFLTLLTGFLAENALIALLLLLPVSETVKNLMDCLLLRLVPPRYVPRMDPERPLSAKARTLCVVSALLSSPAAGPRIAKLLEQYRLANRSCGENLCFGILADLPEGKSAHLPGDEEKIRAAVEAVEALNKKYGGGFLLLLRPRTLAQADGIYMGWERKRGAILELMRLLRRKESGLYLAAGAQAALEKIRYVITLDGDTRLNVGAAGELVAAMSHPLNQPVVEKGRVKAGYGLLAPRIGIELDAAGASDFARIFAGQGGVDPYGSRASDLYFDLYRDGTFTGKGILDVDAYLACLEGRFPENAILSHDLLEGAFLRCGYIGDVELSDGFPAKVLPYFERLQRWVRGDWQAARWLCARVPQADGQRVKNSLPQLDRWKLLDNLRRSLVPVFTFVALMAGMLTNGMDFLLAGVAALFSGASGLLFSLAEGAARPGALRRKRFHAGVIYGLAGAIMRLLLKLTFLPYKAVLCLGAALTALYRMVISKKHMLQWVTAADSEARSKGSLLHHIRRFWPAIAAGIYALAFSPYPFGMALGLYWLLAPAIACSISQPRKGKTKISRAGRLYLLQCAGDIWRYFTDFLRPEDHYLPPDNVQEAPPQGPAHRTSPTNIGLAMLSVLAASDLGLCDLGQLRQLLGCMLTTVEQLPKWHGHLYNWYDTQSLQPLQPPYISTVDSGNLAGCLLVLKEGLSGLDTGLARRAEALLEAMDFSRLYDPTRRLFRIGLDPAAPESRAESFYDLMASEARLTSYYAVAKGQVPRKHWRRLGRGQTALGPYAGMASWTGTMFEYLMPNLIMPCYENSLIWESVKFCIYAQKRAAGNRPWGVSESAFYALDPGGSYQYKAHGTPALALKRGMGEEYVVAPYATFLSLPWSRGSALKNLRRLSAMGAEGRWGFIEALDFSPGRGQGREPGFVRTYMAHHLGMSLISIANTLLENLMPKRFMADSAMAAYGELLQEKVPVGEYVRKQPPRETPVKPRRPGSPGWRLSGKGTDWKNPQGTLLSNGAYQVLVLETGASRSMYGKKLLTRFVPQRLGTDCGLQFYFSSGGKTRALLPAPLFSGEGDFSWEFSGGQASICCAFEDLETELRTAVSEKAAGELRLLQLKNTGDQALEGTVALYFEPVLEEAGAYFSHPAFSKLGLETQIGGDRVLVRRRGSPMELCLVCDRQIQADSSKESALGRGGVLSMNLALDQPAGGTEGAVLDPCVLVRVALKLAPGQSQEMAFSLAAGPEAEKTAETILKERPLGEKGRLDLVAESLGMDLRAVARAMERLPQLLLPPLPPRAGAGGGPSLWPYGISGDHPLLAQAVETGEAALALVREQALLHLCGFHYDLALVVEDGGDYRRPLQAAIQAGRAEAGLEALPGLFVVDAASQDTAALFAMSRDGDYRRDTAQPELAPRPSQKSEKPEFSWHFEADGSFVFSGRGILPPNAWSQMLTNGTFGALMTDAGTGHMWAGNARENRLTPWENDSLSTWGPERLLLDGTSAFAALDDQAYRVRYGLGFAQWEKKETRVTAFVPPELPMRILLIENLAQHPLRLQYSLETEKQSLWQTGNKGEIVLENTGNSEFPDTKFYVFTSDKENPFTEKTLDKEIVIQVGIYEKGKSFTEISVTEARALLEETKAFWKEKTQPWRFRSPWPSLDTYVNGWALYQVIACRMLGRCSVYQSGGAYGFRDQLQDACAVTESAPDLARRQILLAAAHQYAEGDVQHWWHPTEQGDRGVRTRCSDDLLWLPYAAADYVEKTGDRDVLDQCCPYLRSAPLASGEADRYEKAEVMAEQATLLDHCRRALEAAWNRGLGLHGLPLMGSGDWNDGYSKVGAQGRGESVWLAWFMALTLRKFAPFCGKEERKVYLQRAEALCSAATACWDGDRFLRGYFDDGTPLGARESAEGALDSVAQSFAALAGCPDKEKVQTALQTALKMLFDRKNQVVKLLTPPFSGAAPDPGYISRYPEGVRENGGQYTHAAIWLAMACFEAGMEQAGRDVLLALLPQAHSWKNYRVEPYVLAADVYAHPRHLGRGGWSWYTGAAGWYLQALRRYLPGCFEDKSE